MQFNLFNIPVRICSSFWIFLLFFTGIYRDFSMEAVILGVVLIMSLLVHELGHALTALYFGARPQITLEAFGGNAQYDGYGISPKQHFWITLNGPLFESLLIAIPYYLLKTDLFHGHYYWQFFLYATLQLNILWCLLNLIPVSPLDGGKIAEYLLIRRFSEKGAKASLLLGIGTVCLVAPFLFLKGFFFFGTLLVIFGFRSYQTLQKTRVFHNEFGSYAKGLDALKSGDTSSAKKLLRKLVKSQDLKMQTASMEALVKAYILEGEEQKAYELLLGANHAMLSKDAKLTLCRLAFHRKNYELISSYAHDIYEIDPTFETAFMIAEAYAAQGDSSWANAWLQTASQFEEADKEKIRKLQEELFSRSV